jgi:pimeloyl-ACP methyl ester carboxylesterase
MRESIIIIGGYNSLWTSYLKMARDLEDLTGLQAVGVPLMPWHWWAARRDEDATNILLKLDNTVTWSRQKFGADRFVLVGHSAGGLIARLYLLDQPLWGHVYGGVEHVRTVITLGSPHCSDTRAATGWFLTDEANRLVPGALYSERVCYRAVAGRLVQGNLLGDYRQRRAFRMYEFFDGQGEAWGDGVVPVSAAHLDGAEALVLDGVAHSEKYGRDWYGHSSQIIRRWWPVEGTHGQ